MNDLSGVPPYGDVLVAGGAGFIGAHLCRRLLAQGYRVTCLDNFLTGSRQAISGLLNHPRFRLIEHDVIDTLPSNLKPGYIYNLACPASPARYQRDPVHTLRTCVQGAVNLLELAVAVDARILQASTSEVYGDPTEHPQREKYRGNVNPIGVRSCYDEGKRCAETLFSDFARQYGAKVKIARIFNTYGPGMAGDDGRVVSNFISQALQGKALTVYGDGSQTRSLCYVDDMVDALLRLMESPNRFMGPVNLGSTEEVTVLQIAERVRELSGARLPLVYQPMPADDPALRCPDIRLARRYLGWQPTVSLQRGLKLTYDHFAEAFATALP